MDVSIFGLGYVGAVTAGCLAEQGHRIIGADVQQAKVDAFNSGISPIIEPELDDLLQTAKREGRLSATTDAAAAVAKTDASIICVGTPSLASGRLNLDFVRKVSEQISQALRESGKKHIILFRSTMLPGSTRSMVRDFFEDLRTSGQVRIYYCPEFLREGTAVKDFREPSLAVVGTHDGKEPESEEAKQLLGGSPSVLAWEGAEMIKYSCNYFHALKVGFANEIGRLCKFLGEDGARVMDVVCSDTKLNISRYYMKPGNPFGGSCLPKDVSALLSFARQEGISLPLLDNTLDTNHAHLDLLIKLITSKNTRKIGLLGLAFKADTDDLRGSPMVAVAETLLGRGYQLSIYDPSLNLSRLIGANEAEIQRRMPHLASLLKADAQEVVESSDLIVASQKCVKVDDLAVWVKPEQSVIDVNGWRELQTLPWSYEGLCW
ncbi:GDP-mannose 6-dehydrogenase [Prosthecobacter debontii]|uniref:UDP-glucose 6-dehydrogenase n=1 Tax=Prosthecobacter debontii TaxID=48467 RepID=A0A1T4XQ67_9BACT|nr:nucleotide sugar dehydrogenase [Prosthecobacter debontii]SKA91692.1 GDP-mannose 6-dehydrogenase [Prosthecobacter debontii]